MSLNVPVPYDDLFSFLEDYRTNLSQLQYTVKTEANLAVGDDVLLDISVPVLNKTVSIAGRVMAPMKGMAGLQLEAGSDGLRALESFYRLVGRLIEDLLVSGRFKVTGQWAEGAAPQPVAREGFAAHGSAPAMSVPPVTTSPFDTSVLGAIEHSGDFDEKGFADLLMRFYQDNATGIAEFKLPGQTRYAWLSKGGIVQWKGEPVVQEECLGVLLTRAGRVSEDQLRTSLKMMNETGQLQGQCLIDMGVMSFPQLVMSLMKQVEIITRNLCTAGESGSYTFHPRESLGSTFVTPPLKAPGFLFSFYKRKHRITNPATTEKRLTDFMDSYIVLSTEVLWDDMRMKKDEQRLLAVMQQRSYRLRQIFSVSTMSRNLTIHMMLALVDLGAVTFADHDDVEQVAARWRILLSRKLSYQADQNPFELLEIHWTSRTPQVEKAYSRLRKEYVEFGRGVKLPDDVAAKRDEILNNVENAYQKLKATASRQEVRKEFYEHQQHVNNGDLLARQAEMLMVRGQWDQVIENLERSVELMPTNGKYRQMLKASKSQSGRGGG